MSERIERWVETLARLTALAGGLVLTALVVVTVVSVTGRSLVFAGLAPVPGDFELVEAGRGVHYKGQANEWLQLAGDTDHDRLRALVVEALDR